jgi:hypothetical protein
MLSNFTTSNTWQELTGVSSVSGVFTIYNRGGAKCLIYVGDDPTGLEKDAFFIQEQLVRDSKYSIDNISQSDKVWVKSDQETLLAIDQLFQSGAVTQPPSFELGVTMGMVDGHSTLDKFGVNPEITTATDPEDVWEFGGEYNYDTDGTAPIQYTSSSDATDTGQTISIQGLDVNGDFVEQEVTTNGQAVVNLTTPLWRVFRMQNVSDNGLSLSGVFYCHTDPTPTNGVPASAAVRAIIDDGNNQTLMALYTIPKGKVGFLYRGELGVELEGNAASLAEYANCHYESRRFGKVFTVKKVVTCLVGGNSIYQDKRSFPDVLPDLTDIKLSVIEVTQTMGIWGTFDILLVDEDKFSTEFLTEIGQSGY